MQKRIGLCAVRTTWLDHLLVLLAALLLSACTALPPASDVSTTTPATTPPQPITIAPPFIDAPVGPFLQPDIPVSLATTSLAYRQDGARHIYTHNTHRIYKGKLPPLLQGVGVMEMDIDNNGQIISMNWLRPPSHPDAKLEIERTARAAAPYPVPQYMGRVIYIDTWLWDKSGRFQLDTLTEGQH